MRVPSSSRALRRAVAVLVALLLLYGLLCAVAAFDAYRAVQSVQQTQQHLSGFLGDQSLLGLSRERLAHDSATLSGAASRLDRDRNLLGPGLALLGLAAPLPCGTVLADAGQLLALSSDIAGGGAEVTRGVDPLLAAAQGGTGQQALGSPAVRLKGALEAGAAVTALGDQRLHRAAARRASIHPGSYCGPFRTFGKKVAQLDADLPRVLRGADALALLPPAFTDLFGFRGRRSYLVLGQDSAELRPTGGFIGSAGIVSFDQGKLAFQEYKDSTAFRGIGQPPILPPEPLRRYLGECCWEMLDANWSPDLPTASRVLEGFLQRNFGIQVDGVIAFDNDAVSDLLEALGPLQVPGYSAPVTASNWFDQATQIIYTGENAAILTDTGDLGKTSALAALLQALIFRLQNVAGQDVIATVSELRAAVAGRHLQLSMNGQSAAVWTSLVGANGALFPAPDGDMLAPVDTNLGLSKVGPYIQRSVTYDVWLDGSARPLRAAVAITYQNTVSQADLADPLKRIVGKQLNPSTGVFEPMPGLFGDYLRLYAPGGTRLLGASGLQDGDPGSEEGLAVFSGYMRLLPGQSGQVTFDYLPVPPTHSTGRYTLRLVKQAGIPAVPYRVTLHYPASLRPSTIPAGATVASDTVSLAVPLNGVTDLTFDFAGATASRP